MAYVGKYHLAWTVELDGSGTTVPARIDLKLNGYVGSSTAVDGSGTPFQMWLDKEDISVPYGIGRTKAVLELKDEDTAFNEIRGGAPQDWVMVFTLNSVVSWTGYVEPERMRQRVEVKAVQRVWATDGLDRLRTIDWYATRAAAISAGFTSQIAIFDGLLSNLLYDGTGLGYRTVVNWRAYNSSVQGPDDLTPVDPFAAYAVPVGNLYDHLQSALGGAEATGRRPSAFDALNEFAKLWQVYVFQGQNLWEIRQVNQFANTGGGGNGAYLFTYDNAASAVSDGYASPVVAWDNTNLTGPTAYDKDKAAQYKYARVEFDHGTVADQILDPFWTNTTFNWGSTGSPTTSQYFVNDPTTPIGSGIPVRIAEVRAGTEASRANLLDPAAIRTDFLALVVNAGSPIFLSESSLYDIQPDGGDTDITFESHAYYAVSADVGLPYTYYLAGWAIGIDDGTDEYWLDNNATSWTDVGVVGTGPGDGQIWTAFIAPGSPTRCTIPQTALPASVPGGQFTLHVRLYQGFDPYHTFNDTTATVEAFAWAPTQVAVFPDGAAEARAYVIETTNTVTTAWREVAETLYYGSGPTASSPARIALTSAPFANTVFSSWGTGTGNPGTDTGYTFAELWTRELLKQYGTAPDVLEVDLRALTASGLLHPWHWFLLGSTDYWLTNYQLTLTSDPNAIGPCWYRIRAQEIRADSLTISTAELYPNPWPPRIPIGDILRPTDTTVGGYPTTVEFETTDSLTVTADVAKTGITLESALKIPLYADMPLRFVHRLAPGVNYEVYVAADASVGDTTVDIIWAVSATFKLGGFFSFDAQTFEWLRNFQRRTERNSSNYFGVVEQWALSSRTILLDQGRALNYITYGAGGYKLSLPRTSNTYTINRAGVEVLTLSGSAPSIPITYGGVAVFDAPYTVAIAFRSDDVTDKKTLFKVTHASGWMKATHSTNEFAIETNDGSASDSSPLIVTAATSNGIWNVALFAFAPATGVAT
ncbi:MAG TPA: hypothetical protein VM238_14855, partial [Phycisphaerae bacterium]|nr:hypothetical protein [Phycisphaerae bacterium]